MPRLVNYPARFEFFRRAAFAIVRDRGVSELSRRAVARELGTSVATVRRLLAPDASLTALAADEVSRRRRFGRWGMPVGAPEDVALRVLRRALPDEDHRIGEELVWWRLVIDRPTDLPIAEIERRHDDAGGGGGSLREQFQIATNGYAADTEPSDSEPSGSEPSDSEPSGSEPSGTKPDPQGDRIDPLAAEIEQHDADLTAVISQVLDLIGVPDAGHDEQVRLRALLDGLNLGVCLGRLTPDEAVAVLAHHLAAVRVAA
jgi:hypothetical protein